MTLNKIENWTNKIFDKNRDKYLSLIHEDLGQQVKTKKEKNQSAGQTNRKTRQTVTSVMEHLWDNDFKYPQTAMPLRLIRRVVQAEFNLTKKQMCGRQRGRHISWPRFIAWWLSTQITHSSYPEIGRAYTVDHTSVMHGVKRVKEWEKTNPEWWDKAQEIRGEFL